MPATVNIPLASSKGSFLITPNVGLMVWTIVVFVISLFILRRWVFPLIGAALDKRARQTAEAHEHEAREGGREILAEAARRAERDIEAATQRAIGDLRREV